VADLLNLFNELDETPKKRSEYLKAPFGYIGGKSKSLPKILPHLPYRNAYVEPFGGSGAILLARSPSKLEVFNDRYSGVTDFYRCLKLDWKRLIERLTPMLHSREEFYWSRETWENCEDRVERAARWYYMQQMSFANKGCVYARGTNPKGKTTFGTRFQNHIKDFHNIHNRIINVQIENLDWSDCIRTFDHHDAVFYLDPPYLIAHGGTYKHDMPLTDHQELISTIKTMKSFVALSGYDNDLYNSVNWDNKIQWEALVSVDPIGAEGHGRSVDGTRFKTLETLWIKEAQ